MKSLNVSRTVSQGIIRVHKPKVEYKSALHKKTPQGSILTFYYKTINNFTKIN